MSEPILPPSSSPQGPGGPIKGPSGSSSGEPSAAGGFFIAFQQMLGPSATFLEIKKAVDSYLNAFIYQIKQEQKKMEERLKQMKQDIEDDG